VILLTAAITQFNEGIHGDGIPYLNSAADKVAIPFGLGKVSRFDISSAFMAFAVISALVALPMLPLSSRIRERQLHLQVWVPVITVTLVVIAFFAGTLIVGQLPPNMGQSGPAATSNVEVLQAVFAALALLMALHGYFTNQPSLVDLLFSRGAAQNEAWTESLRMMLFGVAILPPLIVGLVVTLGKLDFGLAIVYGVFIYGGFMAWTLGIDIVSRNPRKMYAILQILVVFAYAGLITVLWVAVIGAIQKTRPTAFNPVISAALGVILVQVVYGFLYRRTWGNSLSDLWPRERPNYVIFATIIIACVAATPQSVWKTLAVFLVVTALIFYPWLLLRRKLSAFVMIHVVPGSTEAVQRELHARGVQATVVYGTHDIVAHIEASGRESSSDALAELADSVKTKIRVIKGISETETLIDFSDIASYVDLSKKEQSQC